MSKERTGFCPKPGTDKRPAVYLSAIALTTSCERRPAGRPQLATNEHSLRKEKKHSSRTRGCYQEMKNLITFYLQVFLYKILEHRKLVLMLSYVLPLCRNVSLYQNDISLSLSLNTQLY